MSAAEEKARLRAMARARAAAEAPRRESHARRLVEHLLASPLWPEPGGPAVLAYLALDDEPDLDGLWLAETGATIAAPRIDWDRKAMDAAVLGSLEDVELTRRVRQPAARCPLLDPSEIGLVLVPGLLFDRSGGRLGRGAGFYDRYLSRLEPGTVACGVCHAAQVVERVPVEDHDARVRMILTEHGLERTTPR